MNYIIFKNYIYSNRITLLFWAYKEGEFIRSKSRHIALLIFLSLCVESTSEAKGYLSELIITHLVKLLMVESTKHNKRFFIKRNERPCFKTFDSRTACCAAPPAPGRGVTAAARAPPAHTRWWGGRAAARPRARTAAGGLVVCAGVVPRGGLGSTSEARIACAHANVKSSAPCDGACAAAAAAAPGASASALLTRPRSWPAQGRGRGRLRSPEGVARRERL